MNITGQTLQRGCRLAVLLFVTGCSAPDAVRLYVFNCGELRLQDISAFGLTNEQSETRELFVPCYLIDHPKGKLFWDAGLNPELVGKGWVRLESGAEVYYARSVIDQLADIGLSPADIDLLAFSHMHFDHVGAVSDLLKGGARARLLIQRAEYLAAFSNPEDHPVFDPSQYAGLADLEKSLLDGDHDVFGDARVRLLSAPGHTPGHQLLFVDLARTGPVLLSGDLYHFRESRSLRATPVFNSSREETLASMQKLEAFLADRGAALWIQHDRALAASQQLAPAFYD